MKKIKIVLELDAKSVKKIEKAADDNIKNLIESEINNDPDCFIESLGYDNW